MVLLLRILFAVVANGVALLLAAAILDDFEVEAGSFAVAVIVFSVASLVLRPIVIMLVGRYARPMLGVVALVSTYVVLLVTDLVSDGLQIEGVTTWILATLIVWLATMLYALFSLRLVRRAARRP